MQRIATYLNAIALQRPTQDSFDLWETNYYLLGSTSSSYQLIISYRRHIRCRDICAQLQSRECKCIQAVCSKHFQASRTTSYRCCSLKSGFSAISSSSMASGLAEEDFDDEISLTSTGDENGGPDDELFVTKILAERQVDGETRCLIQWQDLSLAEATWEPRENLTGALMAVWEKTKADQRNGLVPKFRLQEWKDANIQHYKSRLARHHLRNLVRARRGYPQTIWTPLQEVLEELAVYSNAEDEADRVDPSPANKSLHQGLSHNHASSPTNQLEERSSEPPTELLVDSHYPQKTMQERLSGTSDKGRAVSPSEKLSLDHPAKLKSTLKDVETTTRKSVRFMIPSSGTSHEVLKRPSLSHRTPAARPAGYTNVFAGGRTRKGRGTLSEAAVNPETHPKFLNSRLKRKIELQRRNREGINAPVQLPSGLISLDHNNPQATPSEHQSANDAKDDDQANGKRRSPTKGVAHWEDEPMEIDPSDSLFVSEQTSPDASDDEAAQLNSPDCGKQPESQTVSKTVSKTVQLGPDMLSVVTLSFDGIPHETGLSWAKQFRSNERLIFTHSCTSQDFLCQTGANGNLSIVRLCEGTVLSYTENDSLKSLASNLRLGSLGLLCRNESFYIYMFFSHKSDGQPIHDSDDATLEYTIFKPVDSLGPLMMAPAPQLRVSDKRDKSSAFFSRPLDRIFGQTYEQLLPIHARDAEKHNFFLAFPPRAGQEALLLSRWLRDSRSNCDIRTSYSAGHWSSFLKLTHGVVIIHEDALWSIRLFPRFYDLLHGRRANFMFWMFSRSLLPVHSLGSRDSPASPPGDIHLHPVFDPGAAFLITPSFLVSEPEHAYSFLKWFWNNYVKIVDVSRPRKLVLCAKVDEWMHSLSLEKIMMRHKHPITASEGELSAKGISDKAIECRWKTLKLLQQLVADAADKSTGSIVLAPEAIDGNDEQSLVNWFGWWSTLHIDQFRRYTVIGCGWQTEERLLRTLRAPNYDDNIINDPDGPLSGLPSQPEPSKSFSAPRSAREDESSLINSRLFEIAKAPRRDWCPVNMYWFPVAYSTSDVAFRLGDIESKYDTYEKWFNFFWKKFEVFHKTKGSQNSYAGLFYTFDEHQASSRTFNSVQRSPWVAIFRAVSPHFRPWKSSELFIWDINYSESISNGRRFCYSDLLEAQQRLIEHIRERTRDVLPLEKVWVGAFGVKPGGAAALDVTLQWLDSVLGKVRDWIPAPAKEIPGRGWVPVTPERSSGDRKGNSVLTDADTDVNTVKGNLQSEDDKSPRKTIFHPPQGHGQQKFTKCRNRLYQRARQIDPKLEGRSFEYIFRPTMDWYNEQCEEGRGFEHVKVMPWRDVFQIYKIEEFLQKRG